MESKFKVGELVMAEDYVSDEEGSESYDVLGVIVDVFKLKHFKTSSEDNGIRYEIDWCDEDEGLDAYPEFLVEGYVKRVKEKLINGHS